MSPIRVVQWCTSRRGGGCNRHYCSYVPLTAPSCEACSRWGAAVIDRCAVHALSRPERPCTQPRDGVHHGETMYHVFRDHVPCISRSCTQAGGTMYPAAGGMLRASITCKPECSVDQWVVEPCVCSELFARARDRDLIPTPTCTQAISRTSPAWK